MSFLLSKKNNFTITLEVVPPAGSDARALLDKLNTIADLPFDAFSVASNPVANSRMSAMVFSHLLQEKTGKPAILHLTVRDHNRLGLAAELWGAMAIGIDTVIAVTGDPSARNKVNPTTTVNNLNVFELIQMAADTGLCTGAVLDFRPEVNGLANEVRRIEKKASAGAKFIVTQPVYDRQTAQKIYDALGHIRVPVIMGILPLLSLKHANFLHDKVAGIAIPDQLKKEMATSRDPIATGIGQAREMLQLAKKMFSGACIMPPFDRFDLLPEIF